MKTGEKFLVSFKCDGRPYTTAKGAAMAWAEGVYRRMSYRPTKSGEMSYKDAGWNRRNGFDPNETEIIISNGLEFEFYTKRPLAVQKAYRRAIKIFMRVMGK